METPSANPSSVSPFFGDGTAATNAGDNARYYRIGDMMDAARRDTVKDTKVLATRGSILAGYAFLLSFLRSVKNDWTN